MRTSNEDSYIADVESRLFLVADGLGGHAAGEIASRMAAATFKDVVARCGEKVSGLEEMLRLAAQEANSRIYEAQRQRPELSGMGSTLTALWIQNKRYYVVQVGDSRAYLYRDGALEQLTRDHSLVWQLFEDGVLLKHELSSHPQKKLVTRCIGPYPDVDIDVQEGDALEGDAYLLCSDGLTDVVSDETLEEVLSDREESPQEMCDALVEMANAGGGPDNVTVLVIRLKAGTAVSRDKG